MCSYVLVRELRSLPGVWNNCVKSWTLNGLGVTATDLPIISLLSRDWQDRQKEKGSWELLFRSIKAEQKKQIHGYAENEREIQQIVFWNSRKVLFRGGKGGVKMCKCLFLLWVCKSYKIIRLTKMFYFFPFSFEGIRPHFKMAFSNNLINPIEFSVFI